jgi:pyruvate formate lyase activating enzyme
VRTPIVPGVNDTEEAIAAIAGFVSGLRSLVKYELLRFHMMAGAKYAAIGLECRAADMTPPDDDLMERLTARAASFGVTVEHT